MSTLRVDEILAQSGDPAEAPSIPGLDKRFATAWVNFNGAGVVAIRSSYNVDSITDNGTGQYAINFSAPMATPDYTPIGSTKITDTTTANCRIVGFHGFTVSSVSMVPASGGGSADDVLFASVAVFGGQA